MIVVCDTFDHEDYPVFVPVGQDVRTKAAEYDGPNMQKVMEVYAMHLPMEMQLAQPRSFHYELPEPKTRPTVYDRLLKDD